MAPCGAILVSALAFVAMALDDDLVMMVPMMPIVMMTVLDHDGLGTGNGRRRDGNRAECCNNVSKFLHVILLHVSED